MNGADISAATSMTRGDIYSTLKYESMITDLDTPPRDTPSLARAFRRQRGRSRLSAPRRSRPAVKDVEEEEVDKDKVAIPDRYAIRWDRDYVEAVLRKHDQKGFLKLNPDRLKYHPFLVTRNPAKPPGIIAKATLMANNPNAHKDDEVAQRGREDGRITPNGADGLINHGEDQATLDLVAALSASPKRSLRRRSELVPEKLITPSRTRSRNQPPVSGQRRSTRGQTSSVLAQASSLTLAQPAETPTQEQGAGHANGHKQEGDAMEVDEEDDILRLGRTPKSDEVNGTATHEPIATTNQDPSVDNEVIGKASEPILEPSEPYADEDMDAEGEDEDAEGESDDGEWEVDEDAEGEDE
jgi:hypothetical protein